MFNEVKFSVSLSSYIKRLATEEKSWMSFRKYEVNMTKDFTYFTIFQKIKKNLYYLMEMDAVDHFNEIAQKVNFAS